MPVLADAEAPLPPVVADAPVPVELEAPLPIDEPLVEAPLPIDDEEPPFIPLPLPVLPPFMLLPPGFDAPISPAAVPGPARPALSVSAGEPCAAYAPATATDRQPATNVTISFFISDLPCEFKSAAA